MTKPAVYAVLTTLLSMQAWADVDPRPLLELSKGESGRLMLVAQADTRTLETRLDSVGIRGEYRNGQVLWVDRRQDGGTVVGMGFQKRF